MMMRVGRRFNVYARRNDDETMVAQRERVLGILTRMTSSILNARSELVNRDLNTAINTRRFSVLNTKPQELTRANFVEQPLILKICKEKLEPIAGGRSKNGWVTSAGGYSYALHDRAKTFVSVTT